MWYPIHTSVTINNKTLAVKRACLNKVAQKIESNLEWFILLPSQELLWKAQRPSAFLAYQETPEQEVRNYTYLWNEISIFQQLEVSSYYASLGFHFLLEFPNNGQGKLNVGINELIWRSLHIFRHQRKLCTITFLLKHNHHHTISCDFWKYYTKRQQY